MNFSEQSVLSGVQTFEVDVNVVRFRMIDIFDISRVDNVIRLDKFGLISLDISFAAIILVSVVAPGGLTPLSIIYTFFNIFTPFIIALLLLSVVVAFPFKDISC